MGIKALSIVFCLIVIAVTIFKGGNITVYNIGSSVGEGLVYFLIFAFFFSKYSPFKGIKREKSKNTNNSDISEKGDSLSDDDFLDKILKESENNKTLEKCEPMINLDCEDDYYEMALVEFQEGKYHTSVYSKAIVESDGDKNKLIACYIKLRVNQLFNRKILEEKELKSKIILERNEAIIRDGLKIDYYWVNNTALARKILSSNNNKIRADIKSYEGLPDERKESMCKFVKKASDNELQYKLKYGEFPYPGQLTSYLYEALNRKFFLDIYLRDYELHCSKCDVVLGENEAICPDCESVSHLSVN